MKSLKDKILKKDGYELYVLETLSYESKTYLLAVEVETETEEIGEKVFVLELVNNSEKASVVRVENEELLQKLAPLFQDLIENSQLKEVTHE